ncbi:hypothetical protein [Enterovirga rhinocerotis]|uniref:Uncharacterized protein n=1 Tax=Enterovirga rhinocerotis TaxID=1339210 RepID=A0A4R7CBN6_9HYPH|nr:hypothetical protein [Enterovirga rhinocerotis]TDR94177.1 hypothetical protein EV668_1455 [Enterovirga rhinocerotis]
MSELRSLSLEAAIVGAVALQTAGRLISARPSLPSLPALPAMPAFPALHLPSFRLRPSGLWIPAAPAILSSPSPSESGAGASRVRTQAWKNLVDQDGLVAFLRARHPTKTAAHVAAATGEPLETVRKWLRHETRPGMRALLVLVCVYELPLVEACLRRHPDWIVRAREDAGRHVLAAELRAFWPRIEAALGEAQR